MKATFTIEADLPMDQEELQMHIDGPKLQAALSEHDEWLRRQLKYGHGFKTADEALEAARSHLIEVVD